MKILNVGNLDRSNEWVWLRSNVTYGDTAVAQGYGWSDAAGYYVERPDGHWISHTIIDSEEAGMAMIVEDSKPGVLLTLTAPTLEERLSLAEAALRVLGAIT